MRPDRGTPLAVGQFLELEVEKAVYRGLALSRHEGRVIFVPRAFPGDRLRVQVASVERGFARAEVVEILEPARGRRPAPCVHAERCGGCAYQGLGYEDQLGLKRDILAETLRRAGAPFEGGFELAPSPEDGWRTRASFHFEERGGVLHLGLHEEGSHTVVDLEHCLQLAPGLNDVARGLKRALEARRDLWPVLTGLHLAAGTESGCVATLEVRLPAAETPRLLPLRAAAPGLTGFAALTAARTPLPSPLSVIGSPQNSLGIAESLAGGGFRHGQVIGASSRDGGEIAERPVTPGDLAATIYHHMGVPLDTTYLDHQGRPNYIVDQGAPLRELV